MAQDSGFGERSSRILAAAMNRVGIRGIVDAYGQIGALCGREDGRVRYGGHLPEEDIDEGSLSEASGARMGCDCVFMTHRLETAHRRWIVGREYGVFTVELFAARGLLDGPTVLLHGVEMTGADIRILAERGVSLAHFPVSNLAEVAPVAECLDAGVVWRMATIGGARAYGVGGELGAIAEGRAAPDRG